ncbi:orotidine-5'-phosphate decarboxylase [Malassezia yamatoensis]|uniref:Endonuclease III homolog n=1 Tax=Malassezia yamatoensis TaxID=253288 RepID=A0AAJ6CFV1_9BASI|nr:orotidine-5'-phosphate decarboxylase [Malassezia yamatoensis]
MAQVTYEDRAANHPNACAKQLLSAIAEKQSNLCVSIDVTRKNDLLDIADTVGPYVSLVKTHIDIVEDFDWELIEQLSALSIKHNFLIFEDRKFADIVSLQYSSGVHRIAHWSHLTNAHLIPGPGIISGLATVGAPMKRGLLLLAEMSTKGSLTTGAYTTANVQAAMQDESDFVMGFIAMHRVHEDPKHIPEGVSAEQKAKDLLILTPGVGLDVKGDGKGQQYRTPHEVIHDSGCDVMIVGRGIYSAMLSKSTERAEALNEVCTQAQRYRDAGWQAYLSRIGSEHKRRSARLSVPTTPSRTLKRQAHTRVSEKQTSSEVKLEPKEEVADTLDTIQAKVEQEDEVVSSPIKKIKMELTEDEKRKVKVPKRWQEQYDLMAKQRAELITPVDTMGCEENGNEDRRADHGRTGPDGQQETEDEIARRLRLTTLVSLMLSSQTKDPVTAAAVYKLQTTLPNGLCLASLLETPDDVIQECIAKVGFFRRKTEYIRRVAILLRDRFSGDVPRTIDELCSLPGVGPKMAFLQMQSMGLNVGIGVDTHVHRISNRLGWCKTNTPEQTRLALQSWLPSELHRVVNKQMVGFGQVICVPVGPRCDLCYLGKARRCPSYRKVDEKSRTKRVPVYYKDGTIDKGYGRVPIEAQDSKNADDKQGIKTEEAEDETSREQSLEW